MSGGGCPLRHCFSRLRAYDGPCFLRSLCSCPERSQWAAARRVCALAKTKTFGDYKAEGHKWIPLATGEYYPDILKDACELYKPVLVAFSQLLKSSESSTALFMHIAEEADGWMRVQLARVFTKYVSPDTPVKRLGPNMRAQRICDEYGKRFRPIREVQAAHTVRELQGAPESVRRRLLDVPAEHQLAVPDTAEAAELAEAYLARGVVGPGSQSDALHVALASVARADVLVSWNFKHIVNLGRIRLFHSVNIERGYPLIEIRTPKEVTTDEQAL